MKIFQLHKPELSLLGVKIEDALDLFQVQDRTGNNPIVCEVEQIYRLLPDICDIRGGYIVLEDAEISVDEGKIRLGNKEITPERKVCNYLKEGGSIAVFICSAGERFSDLSRQYNLESDYLKAYIVDSFGSLVVEKMADYLQEQLQKEISINGQKITNRYSPGYCNWRLADQKQLFELLPENPCCITLTESMLMLPIKSISGIIGIGKHVKKHKYACDVCRDDHCVYRNVRIK